MGHPARECLCDPSQVARYRSKVSGPLLDRIDLQVSVSAFVPGLWEPASPSEGTGAVRPRIAGAWERQRRRFGADGPTCNAEMGPRELRRWVRVTEGVASLLQSAQDRMGLSPRAYHRILKVARTLADLEAEGEVAEEHAAEAIHFRELDRPVD